ncbi:MAG: gamma-glutamyltransferase [Pseudomonadota bacterium]
MPRTATAALLALLAVSCAAPPAVEPVPVLPTSTAAPQRAALAMPDRFSADVVEAVLREGGNAVDAAVAGAFALAVTYPEAGNIGGGGFMLVTMQGQPYFLDYRETAPAGASRDMYLDENGDVVPDQSIVGALAVATPATVAGLWEAHRRFGTQPWARLVQPAIMLAREGFVAPAQLAERIQEESAGFGGRTNFDAHFGSLRGGERFVQADLAQSLQRIADAGRDGFYAGPTAEALVAQMQRSGGIISAADLRDYEPKWREPLDSQWRGYRLLSAPLPSSGGFAVIQLLKMKDELASEFAGLGHNSPKYIHLVAEMEKRVFADRAEYLGDPDVVDVPIDRLIDDAYIASRAREVNPTAISTLEAAQPGLEGRHTTHLSIVDGKGNAVANTYTLNTWFGSGLVVEGAGFLLNNEMDDFSIKPGTPNYYGVVGKDANAIAPGKRMLSSMSPTILLDGSKPVMVLGSPGGSTIFTSVFQSVVNVLDFDMTPSEAVAATRFHHQLLPPDLVTFSVGNPLPDDTVRALSDFGYRAEPHPWVFGDVQLIWWNGESFETGSDPRGRGVSRQIMLKTTR